jgi:hypothetical protein
MTSDSACSSGVSRRPRRPPAGVVGGGPPAGARSTRTAPSRSVPGRTAVTTAESPSPSATVAAPDPASTTAAHEPAWSSPSSAAEASASSRSGVRTSTGAVVRSRASRKARSSRCSASVAAAASDERTPSARDRAVTCRKRPASAARLVTLTTPTVRRVTGCTTGTATHAQRWKDSTKCSAPTTVAARPLSRAVPMPHVPTRSSSKLEPNWKPARSRSAVSAVSDTQRQTTFPCASASARLVRLSASRSATRSSTGAATRVNGESSSASATGGSCNAGSTPLHRDRRHEASTSSRTPDGSAPAWKAAQSATVGIPTSRRCPERPPFPLRGLRPRRVCPRSQGAGVCDS